MKKKITGFILLFILLVSFILLSMKLGSINVTFADLFRGLFLEYNPNVAIIYDLRFPRIIIAIFAGSALAVSGVLCQSVMRNPLADPGIIGISSGACFTAVLITAFFPMLFFWIPLFACLGGFVAFALVYSLAWKEGFSPFRIILVGVAVNAVFVGLMDAFTSMTGGNQSGVASIVNANISMKTWEDVRLLSGYVAIGLVLAVLVYPKCNLLALEDKTIRSLGINVTAARIMVSVVAVLLAAITTAVAGAVSFLGLIVPHIGRILVGSDHKVLIPFSMLLGSVIMVAADLAGRILAAPYEIPASIVLSVVGGPFFIFLLKKGGGIYGS